MNLSSPLLRVVTLGVILAFVAAAAAIVVWLIGTLTDDQVTSLGHWLDGHSNAIWGFVVGAAPSVATYLFGRRAGSKAGKTEAYNSAIATASTKQTGEMAADVLRSEAASHGLAVKV